MTMKEMCYYLENKRKNQYKQVHSRNLEEHGACKGLTNKEYRRFKVKTGKASYGAKASKFSYNKLWRYNDVKTREAFTN